MQPRKWTYLLPIVISLLACTGNRYEISDGTLKKAQNLLWEQPQETLELLYEIDSLALSPTDKEHYIILLNHAKLKNNLQIAPLELSQPIKYFLFAEANRYVGEAYYVQGAGFEQNGQYDMASHCLKEAERVLDKIDDCSYLQGLVIYRQGVLLETDNLKDAANERYRKALPLLKQSEFHLYTACCMRDIARTTSLPSERDSLLEEALNLSYLAKDTILTLDIQSYIYGFSKNNNSADPLEISRFMVKQGNWQYAADLCFYFIENKDLDSATYYLDLLARDTLNRRWSQEQYLELKNILLSEKGNYKDAYNTLKRLYDIYRQRFISEGNVRTYIIQQSYDILWEKEQSARLQKQRQQLYLALSVSIGSFIIMLVFVVLLRRLHREQEATQKQQMHNLTKELTLRREALQKNLLNKIELTKSIQLDTIMQKYSEADLPIWVRKFIETNLYTTVSQLGNFQDEFNGISQDFLKVLKTE